jgi:DNA invertase Pin-like site-specific DNA recombinase
MKPRLASEEEVLRAHRPKHLERLRQPADFDADTPLYLDRPGFSAMLKAAHQRNFDILVFWALGRLTREGTRATLNYLQRLESKGVGYVSYQEQWLDSTGPF